ncbi:class I SAM-dependent methyltransferase [Magnetospirillum sp. SS-4]|uniref:class I SAM-dependent methyltransferase n=1 Tax=Magnetospirillum sp. SS-4 TaxID=2681465 RepID=UPI00137EF0F8|nr:class I SAM-dependent methyltransferase [Magnetospirillum sp. SS-4]CAA7618743.1 hypothetical protein MTBSS4_220027 [Magnetospirillum sp. SS-4]
MDDTTIQAYARVLSRVAMVYHCTLEEHGATAPGVAWRDDIYQHRGFERLTSGIDRRRPVTVNDVGCGYGALFGYLDRHFTLAGYCGTDICEAMIEAAGRRVQDPRARFAQNAMPMAAADWSIASGTFNLSAGTDGLLWRKIVEDVLREMARLSRIGFAVSMLRPDGASEFLWGSEPEPWLRFCHAQPGGWKLTIDDAPDEPEWRLIAVRAPAHMGTPSGDSLPVR